MLTDALKRSGGMFLRPWHLTYATSCGLKGFIEPDSRLRSYYGTTTKLKVIMMLS